MNTIGSAQELKDCPQDLKTAAYFRISFFTSNSATLRRSRSSSSNSSLIEAAGPAARSRRTLVTQFRSVSWIMPSSRATSQTPQLPFNSGATA